VVEPTAGSVTGPDLVRRRGSLEADLSAGLTSAEEASGPHPHEDSQAGRMMLMIAKVFVSTGDSTEIVPGQGGPGGTWESIGTIDSSRERDLWKMVQTYLGFRSTPSPLTLDFYIDGHPKDSWVQASQQPSYPNPGSGFWVAIDVYGDAARYLVSTRQAEVRPLTKRRPEPHPGLFVAPMFVGIRLTSDQGLFREVRPNE
jgi:hypothetical protein